VNESLGLAAGAVTLTLGLLTLIGLVIRYALLPYLREQLRLTRETHSQLTMESSPEAEPTVRDDITEIREQQHKHAQEIEDAALELRAMALMFDGHLEWAQHEVDRLRRERQDMVDEIWNELKRQHTRKEARKMTTPEEERETETPVPADQINPAPKLEEPDHD
jgi:hypothetical protein